MDKFKEMRQRRGLTQDQVSAALGTTKNTVWRWENGLRSPDLEMLRRLSKVLGCTIDELVGNPTTPPADRGPGGN